jgi:thymidylate synthase ThyX
MNVYPMGFIPEVKKKLIILSDEHSKRLKSISRVGKKIVKLVNSLDIDQIELDTFFKSVRKLDQLITDGIEVNKNEKDFITHVLRTEEELAVIFAKISRNPGGFEEVAHSVTEEGASNFHKKWVVSIEGYGHASVAEHAIIHLGVENIPSLDGDWITDNRLASFTEFSARFKGRQEIGYFVPKIVKKDVTLSKRWRQTHKLLFDTYDKLMKKGREYIQTKEAIKKYPQRAIKVKTVADQFKNLMPASRLTSIGVTMNAREMENVLKKLLSSEHESIRNLGKTLKKQAYKVTPTLVKYADPNEYLIATRAGLLSVINKERSKGYIPKISEERKLVRLLDYDRKAESKILAAFFFNTLLLIVMRR